ncbi:MAG: ATP-binding protein [Paracoccus sp. (in: a-proteobacteria)]
MFHRILGADPATVRDTLAAVRDRFRQEVSDDTLGRLELVLAEVMNNIAEHAAVTCAEPRCKGDLTLIHLCIVSHRCGLACALTDNGVSLPDDCLLPRNLPQLAQQELPEGGFGWYLIQDLTQELCYYREDQRNFLAFRVPCADEAQG